jgi:hypothetical protein
MRWLCVTEGHSVADCMLGEDGRDAAKRARGRPEFHGEIRSTKWSSRPELFAQAYLPRGGEIADVDAIRQVGIVPFDFGQHGLLADGMQRDHFASR